MDACMDVFDRVLSCKVLLKLRRSDTCSFRLALSAMHPVCVLSACPFAALLLECTMWQDIDTPLQQHADSSGFPCFGASGLTC